MRARVRQTLLLLTSACVNLALLACASSGAATAGTSAQPPMRTLLVSDQLHLETATDASDRSVYSAAADRVFALTVAALADLGADPTLIDPPRLHASSMGLQRRRVLGKTALSKFFDCGSDLTGRRADSDQLSVNIDATVEATSPKRAELRLLVKRKRSLGVRQFIVADVLWINRVV